MPPSQRPPGTPDPDAEDRSGRRADEARAGPTPRRWQAWSLEGSDGQADIADTRATYSDAQEFDPPSELWQPPWFQRSGPRAVGLAAALVVVGASLGGTAFMELEHRAFVREQHRSAEFAAAAREGVTKLMSIDANHAQQDMQRALDDSTGELREELSHTGAALADKVEESKMSTTVIVDAVAVESRTEDSGIVLVAARSDSASPHVLPDASPEDVSRDGTKRPMNSLRILVHLRRDYDRLKMAKVDFLQ